MNLIRSHVVLIVEDEEIIRTIAADAFQLAGFTVLEAEHSASAILIAFKNPNIDLLFTDVNMPGDMDGIRLAEHLFDARPLLKIIITSARPLARQVGHLNAHFLPKPYEVRALSHIGDNLLAA
jgi:CheY-like chemotaxis protein